MVVTHVEEAVACGDPSTVSLAAVAIARVRKAVATARIPGDVGDFRRRVCEMVSVVLAPQGVK